MSRVQRVSNEGRAKNSASSKVTIESSRRGQATITVRDGGRTQRFTVPSKPLVARSTQVRRTSR